MGARVYQERINDFTARVGRAAAAKRFGISLRTLAEWVKVGAPVGRKADVGVILRRHEAGVKSAESRKKNKEWAEGHGRPGFVPTGKLPTSDFERRQRPLTRDEKLPDSPPATNPRVTRAAGQRKGLYGWEPQEIFHRVKGPGRARGRQVGGAPVHVGEVIYVPAGMKPIDPVAFDYPEQAAPGTFDPHGFIKYLNSLAKRKTEERRDLVSVSVVLHVWAVVPHNPAYQRLSSLVFWRDNQGDLIPWGPIQTSMISAEAVRVNTDEYGGKTAFFNEVLLTFFKGTTHSVAGWSNARLMLMEGAQIFVYRRGVDEDLKRFDIRTKQKVEASKKGRKRK